MTDYRRMHRNSGSPPLLDQYREIREDRLKNESKHQQAAAGLLVTGLQQRLLSSVEAFARTLRVHRKTVQRQWEEGARVRAVTALKESSLDLLTGSVGNNDDRATFTEDQLQAEEDAQVAAASAGTLGPTTDSSAKRTFPPKNKSSWTRWASLPRTPGRVLMPAFKKLVEWIREHMCPNLGQPGAPWTDIRAIIFTEYDDTKRYLKQQLEAAIQGSDGAEQRIEIYHGPTPPAKREEIKQAFNATRAKRPVRILVATDAAREGLNLQAHCWNLFHFDVPWNPSAWSSATAV